MKNELYICIYIYICQRCIYIFTKSILKENKINTKIYKEKKVDIHL